MLRLRHIAGTDRGPGKRWHRIVGRAAGLLATGLLCFFALRRTDLVALKSALAGASVWPLLAAMAIDLAPRTLARTRRTAVTLRAVSPAAIGFSELVLVVMAGGATGIVIPGPSEEGVQIALLGRRFGFRLADLLSAQVIEKALSAISMALLGLFFLPPVGIPRVPLGIAALAVGAMALHRVHARRGLPVMGMLEGFAQVTAANLLCAVMIWLCFRSVGVHVGFVICLQIFTVTACAAALPLSPGQLGVVEAAFVLAATRLGLASGPALAVGILYHATHVIPAVLGGLGAAWHWRSFLARTAGTPRPIAPTEWRSPACPT